MIGEDDPGPGNGTFHAKFSFADQVTGIVFVSWLTPFPFGPRNRAQSLACAPAPTKDPAKTAADKNHGKHRRMVKFSRKGIRHGQNNPPA